MLLRYISRGLEHGLEKRVTLLPEVKTEVEVVDMKDRRLGVPGRCKNTYKESCGKREHGAKRVQMTTALTG